MYRTAVIIDDSQLERYLAERMISVTRFAAEVKSFSNAPEALAWLRVLTPEEFPDFILVDIQMPIMNGFGFVEEYSQLPEEVRRHCKIVVMSSSLADEDHNRIKRTPAISAFLQKPLKEYMFYDI